MVRLSRRAFIIAICGALGLGLLVAALPADDGRTRAGTVGPAADDRPRLTAGEVPTDVADVPTEPDGGPSTTTTLAPAAEDAAPAVVGSSASSSTVPASPDVPAPTTSTTTVPVAERSLVGRVAMLRYVEPATPGQPTSSEVWSFRPDGSDLRRELDGCVQGLGMSQGFDVAPDGRTVVRGCAVPGVGWSMVLEDVATGERRPVMQLELFDALHPAWSPDGRLIAMIDRSITGTTQDLVLVDAATGATRRVPVPLELLGILSWSPDSTRVLNTTGYVVEIATGTVEDWTDRFPALPSGLGWSSQSMGWGRDGSVYVAQQVGVGASDSGFRLYRHAPGAAAPVLVFETVEPYLDLPRFLPDGRMILRRGFDTIVTTAPDGSGGLAVALPAGVSGIAYAAG